MKKLKVIPDGWSEHHRPAAYGFLTGTCRGNGPDEESAWTPENPGGVTDGPVLWAEQPCSVQILAQFGRDVVVVGMAEVVITHRVSLPIDVDASYGDIVTVMSNPDDEHLNGTRLRVIFSESGTTNWTRELGCEELNHGR